MEKNKNQPGTVQQSNTKFDWEEIKNRLADTEKALTQTMVVTSDEKKAIFKARANALAIENEDTTVNGKSIQIIGFRLATEMYGIETAYVREVYPLKDFTILPGVPAFVVGIINVRGQIISVIDLKKFFHFPEKGIGELNKVIILKNEKMEFGVLADEITGTLSVAPASIQHTLPNIHGIGNEYLKGITNEHLILLNAEKILTDDKIMINQ